MKRICVLMATYNPESYIFEQVQSIINQKDVQIEIIIRDDGSINKEWIKNVKEFSNNITIIEGNNLGIAGNIKALIDYAFNNNIQADYWAYSDQDDYWDNDKLSSAVQKLDKMDNSKPCVYYSNLLVCDKLLNPNHNHFAKDEIKNSKEQGLARYATYACTTVFNKEMLRTLSKNGFGGLEFDVAIYLIGIYVGESYYDEIPHIHYRMHGDNLSGQHYSGMRQVLFRFSQLLSIKNMEQPYSCGAQYLLDFYVTELQDDDIARCQLILNAHNSLLNKITLLSSKLLDPGNIRRKVFNIIRILFNKY